MKNYSNNKSDKPYLENKDNEAINSFDSDNNELINVLNKIPENELNQKLKSGWSLVWNDEFNYHVLNSKYWTLQNGGGIWGNNELQYYTNRTDNCYIDDGKLVLRGLKEDYQNYQYTSARIVTKKKVEFLYGKIEVKAKFPEGDGLFPAIWLLPCDAVYSDKEENVEIDIVEIVGNDPRFIYGVAHFPLKKQVKYYEKYSDGSTDFSQGFHVYSIEWSPQEMRWLVDDKVYFSLDLKETFKNQDNPFDKKFYLIMNQAIGGNWPGNDLSKTTFPSLVEIDYVRYYHLIN